MKQISKSSKIRIAGIADIYRSYQGRPIGEQLTAATDPERPMAIIEEIAPEARTPLRTARRRR